MTLILPDIANAQQMEFNVGFAYDHPIDKPLPELTDGFGYNFSACLWLKKKFGLAVGALSTRHDYTDETDEYQSFQLDAERDVIYFEGRYKFYKANRWEFIGLAGYSFSNNIHGGDSNGGYIEFRDSSYYDSERIGYEGNGYWIGLSAYRAIQSFHQGYFLFASARYMIVEYNTNQYYHLEIREGSQNDILVYQERDTNLSANSFSIHLGVVLRFDFANF